MNKLLSIAVISALLATAASADFMRVEGSVGAWQSDPTGTIKYGNYDPFDVVDTAGFEATTNTYAWIYIKHPIPIVPNLRVEYANPNFEASTKATLEYGDYEFSAGASNALSLTQYDAVLYYNILDNTFWTTIDLGLDIKFIDGNYNISGNETVGSNSVSVDQDFDLVMPLGYVRGRVQIPVTEIGIEAIVRGVSYTGNTVIDAQVKLDYTMDFVPVIQPGIEIGYRHQQVTLDAGSIGIDANIDTTFSGVYAGIMLRF